MRREGDMNFKEFIKWLGWSKNKFYKDIKRISSKDGYDIDIGKFRVAGETKEDYTENELNYLFKKEWKDLAFVLFTMYDRNPYYRTNSSANKISIDDVARYNHDCLTLVKQKLPEQMSREVQMHPVYLATIMETTAMGKVSMNIEKLMNHLSKVPVETRAAIYANFDRLTNELLLNAYELTVTAKEQIASDRSEFFEQQLYGEYEYVSLDKYLAQMLKNEMDGDFTTKRKKNQEKVQKILDDFEDGIARFVGDAPDEEERINYLFDKLNIMELLEAEQGKLEESRIEQMHSEAENMAQSTQPIHEVIEKMLDELKQNKEIDPKKQIEKLEKIQEMLLIHKNEDTDAEASDSVLKRINYSIHNRQG